MKRQVGNLKSGIKGLVFLLVLSAVAFIGGTAFTQDKIAFGPDDTLEQIREKIKLNNYNFTVEDNWVSRLSPEEKAKMFKKRVAPPMNQRKIVPNTDALLRAVANTKAVATSFDWRNVDGKSYIGAIHNQGSAGTCYAFGACAAAETTYNFKNGLYDANCVDFSESYIAWTLSSVTPYSIHFDANGADYEYYELYALTLPGAGTGIEGICSEANFPYQTTQPSQTVINASKNFQRVTFSQWKRVFPTDIANTTEQIKTAITTYGAVDVAVQTSSPFESYKSGIFEDGNVTPNATPYYYTTSDHAVALVGWNDSDGAWILRNSWGASWGESGYMRIKYFNAAVNTAATYLEAEVAGAYSISGTVTLANGSSAVPTRQNRHKNVGVKASAQELGMGPVNLIADPGVNKFKVLPSAKASSGTKQTATFTINYLVPGNTDPWSQGWNAIAWPAEAKTAFEFAANAWAAELNSAVPITIDAMWTNSLPAGVLGSSGALEYFKDFANAPLANTWYQVSLANALSGSDLDPKSDMFIAYSSTFDWYYGTDGNTPITKYDLVTVSMHEICHSLGFAGSMRVLGGIGSWGSGTGSYFAYDNFTQNGSGQKLVTAFTNSSAALAAQLTGGNLFYNATNANAGNGGTPPDIYAPDTWSQGSSYSHLATKYDGTSNALMTYSVANGEAVHSPGPITQGLLKDEGWSGGGGGGGLANVVVSDGIRSGTTGADGTFTITGVPDGTFTVTPVLSGYTFTPMTRSVTVSGGIVTGCDFTAAQGGTDFTATIGTTFTYMHSANFDKKPTVYVTYTDIVSGRTKKKTVKVTDSSKDFPSSTVDCLWTAKATAGEYILCAKGKVAGVKFEAPVGTVTVVVPTITSVSSTDISTPGNEITVTGTYFGTKPKAWFAYTRIVCGQEKTCKKTVKIIKPVGFVSTTGASTLNIVVPKFKGDESEIVLWIDSGTGQGVYPF